MNDEILEDGSLALSASDVNLTPQARGALEEAIKWSRYYFYIGIGALALQLLIQIAMSVNTSGAIGMIGAVVGAGVGLAILGAFVGYPIYRFWQFITKTPNGMETGNMSAFLTGLNGLRSAIKFLAILTIIVVVLYAILILFMVGTGAAAGLG